MQDRNTGRTAFYRSAGSRTGPFKVVRMVNPSTFSNLVMKFPKTSPGSTDDVTSNDPEGAIEFPALYELYDVTSFVLLGGCVQVVYVT